MIETKFFLGALEAFSDGPVKAGRAGKFSESPVPARANTR
jgi:hypothetical protein